MCEARTNFGLRLSYEEAKSVAEEIVLHTGARARVQRNGYGKDMHKVFLGCSGTRGLCLKNRLREIKGMEDIPVIGCPIEEER